MKKLSDVPTNVKAYVNYNKHQSEYEAIHEIKSINVRDILPQMVDISNNSRITNSVAIAIKKNFSEVELNDYKRWLQLINQEVKRRKF